MMGTKTIGLSSVILITINTALRNAPEEKYWPSPLYWVFETVRNKQCMMHDSFCVHPGSGIFRPLSYSAYGGQTSAPRIPWPSKQVGIAKFSRIFMKFGHAICTRTSTRTGTKTAVDVPTAKGESAVTKNKKGKWKAQTEKNLKQDVSSDKCTMATT